MPDAFATMEALTRLQNVYDERIRVLVEKFDRVHIRKSPNPELIYHGKHLVDDFGGKNPPKWALYVVDHLFSKEELRAGVLEDSNRTDRDPLSPNRVKLMKLAMVEKFEFLKDDEVKKDKNWAMIKDRVNNKGRNIAYRFRQLFTKETNC